MMDLETSEVINKFPKRLEEISGNLPPEISELTALHKTLFKLLVYNYCQQWLH